MNFDINDLLATYGKAIKDVFLWLIAVLFGAGARISYRSNREKLKRNQIISVIITALAVGFIVDNFVTHLGYENLRGGIVAISSLFSEGLVNWLFKNEGSIFGDLFRYLLRRSDGGGSYRNYETGKEEGSIAEEITSDSDLETESDGETDL